MIINTLNIIEPSIGGKAKNLNALNKLNVIVPKWLVLPIEALEVKHPINDELIHKITSTIPSKYYAVRSSAIDEDGDKHSFAGMFESHLYVKPEDLKEKINAVWESAFSERVKSYCSHNNIETPKGTAVIVQQMVDSDVSGVAFGLNPITGNKSSKVISAVYGLGEGLVSGELDADTFTINENNIKRDLANKTHAFYLTENGFKKADLSEEKANQSTLTDEQVRELETVLINFEKHFGSPQDVEFAYANEQLYILQTRPVTTKANKPEGPYTLWDNSNIIESYPGVTTPLTYSFITKMYEGAYIQFVRLLGVAKSQINKHADVFANTLGLIRGRVYYNLLSWYKMLAMVPGYSINARYMENMMGVKESFDLDDSYVLKKGVARLRIVLIIFKFLWLHWTLPTKRKRFIKHLNKTMNYYNSIDLRAKSIIEVKELYLNFEQTLLKKWKAPLINDFFAMIWFGILQKMSSKYADSANQNLHNDLLCGSNDIISTEPIHRTITIASLINQSPSTKELFINEDETKIWQALENGNHPEIKKAIDEYINKFGDRCAGELKLESIPFSVNPLLFIRQVKSYVIQGITTQKTTSSVDNELRENAEAIVYKALKGKWFKKRLFNYVLSKTREMVSSRENLRYERTRGFGMVRKLFNTLGDKFANKGIVDNSRDIYYLKLEELLLLADEKENFNTKELVATRKQEFENYKLQEPPAERFYTYGNNFSDEYIYSREKIDPAQTDLQGIGCCPGNIIGTVEIILDPTEPNNLNNNILVTRSTDPGWVGLFPKASAIIVERGSLLSHSAIVAREMGIPCIVSVSGLLNSLHTGDEIQMDGSTGAIKILKKNG